MSGKPPQKRLLNAISVEHCGESFLYLHIPLSDATELTSRAGSEGQEFLPDCGPGWTVWMETDDLLMQALQVDCEITVTTVVRFLQPS